MADNRGQVLLSNGEPLTIDYTLHRSLGVDVIRRKLLNQDWWKRYEEKRRRWHANNDVPMRWERVQPTDFSALFNLMARLPGFCDEQQLCGFK